MCERGDLLHRHTSSATPPQAEKESRGRGYSNALKSYNICKIPPYALLLLDLEFDDKPADEVTDELVECRPMPRIVSPLATRDLARFLSCALLELKLSVALFDLEKEGGCGVCLCACVRVCVCGRGDESRFVIPIPFAISLSGSRASLALSRPTLALSQAHPLLGKTETELLLAEI